VQRSFVPKAVEPPQAEVVHLAFRTNPSDGSSGPTSVLCHRWFARMEALKAGDEPDGPRENY
jgi:hypothetical protein